jgi:protease II
MNNDHSLVAFTVDIGNTERCTGGLKDMKSGKILPGWKVENISQMEVFGKDLQGQDMVYYVEMNEHNRPYKVRRRSAAPSSEYQTVFIDDDPTHYIDIHVSKDHKFLFINSGTKEDSEVWVIKDDEPLLLIPRVKDVRVHIEHLRDFFLIISNNE